MRSLRGGWTNPALCVGRALRLTTLRQAGYDNRLQFLGGILPVLFPQIISVVIAEAVELGSLDALSLNVIATGHVYFSHSST